jgi:hypothetical protein
MEPLEDQLVEAKNWEFAQTLSGKENPMNKTSVKGSQFEQSAARVLRCLCRLRRDALRAFGDAALRRPHDDR